VKLLASRTDVGGCYAKLSNMLKLLFPLFVLGIGLASVSGEIRDDSSSQEQLDQDNYDQQAEVEDNQPMLQQIDRIQINIEAVPDEENSDQQAGPQEYQPDQMSAITGGEAGLDQENSDQQAGSHEYQPDQVSDIIGGEAGLDQQNSDQQAGPHEYQPDQMNDITGGEAIEVDKTYEGETGYEAVDQIRMDEEADTDEDQLDQQGEISEEQLVEKGAVDEGESGQLNQADTFGIGPQVMMVQQDPWQCPLHFERLYAGGKCYNFVTHRRTWFDADKLCKSFNRNAHLAVIENGQEQNEIASRLRSLDYKRKLRPCECSKIGSYKNFFIAGQRVNDNDCKTRFVWKTPQHREMSFKAWGKNEPNCQRTIGSKNPKEGCAVMTTLHNWNWNDVQCGRSCCAICELDPKIVYG
jgi:hypothetical protein